jgi:hypothetical protein
VRRLRAPLLLALFAAATISLLAAVSGAASPLSGSSAAANSVTYQDSTGEDPAAPDIAAITVSNNDAGVIQFQINVPNRPQLTQDIELDLFVDSDNNTATGDPDLAGTDYLILVQRNEVFLLRWDGTGYIRRFGDPSSVTLSLAYQGGFRIGISAAELGNTRQFKFIMFVGSGVTFDPVTGDPNYDNIAVDIAPGGGAGLYAFEVRLAKPTLVVRRFGSTPARPIAGRAFALWLQAARSDTGALLQGGQVRCLGRVGGSALRAQSGQFVGRRAVCTWRLPPKAKGKRFRGSITIVFEGLRTTRSFSRVIG